MTTKSLILLICASIFSLHIAAQNHHHVRKQELPKEELSLLNNAIKSAGVYENDRTHKLDSIRRLLDETPVSKGLQRWQIAQKLTEEYLPMRADSALHYSELAIILAKDIKRPDCEIKSRISRVNALSTAGIFTRATAEFNNIPGDSLSKTLKVDYYAAGRKLYGYMRAYVEGDTQFFSDYSDKYMQYDDSLLSILPADSKMKQFILCERMVEKGQYSEAKKNLEALLSSVSEDDNIYGMTAFQMAIVYKNGGDQTQYAAYLAKAAISDIKVCVKDGLALPTLADWLYHQGELSDAFRYINFALEEAMNGNVRMRTVTIAALLPLIDEAYQDKINASRDELMIYFLLALGLLILSGILLTVLMREIKKSRATTRKLTATSKVQENYIGHFIGMCSSYAKRLESLQKLVGRKLAAGQAEDLQKMISSGKFGDDLNAEFYTAFDAAFNEIFPNFVSEINSLFREEEKIELKKEHTLTPELRIYAFVRLGVEESTKIAQILNYSVSTVYAYRNKMRNKAIDRENFDRDVVNLGREIEA